MKLTTLNLVGILEISEASIKAQGNNTLSNSQKSFQLTAWTREALTKKTLPNFLRTVEEAISALPKNKFTVPTFNATTGVKGTKAIKPKEVAKRAMKTAWKNAVKDKRFAEYRTDTLEFKLDTPYLKPVGQPTSIEERIEKLLTDSVDGEGMAHILKVIERMQIRHTLSVARLAAERADLNLALEIQRRVGLIVDAGLDRADAVKAIAQKDGKTTEEIESALVTAGAQPDEEIAKIA